MNNLLRGRSDKVCYIRLAINAKVSEMVKSRYTKKFARSLNGKLLGGVGVRQKSRRSGDFICVVEALNKKAIDDLRIRCLQKGSFL